MNKYFWPLESQWIAQFFHFLGIFRIYGRWPQRKTTLVENDLKGRRPQWKTTSMEDNLNVRQPQWKTTSMEDNLNGRWNQCKTTSMEDDNISLPSKPILFWAWPSSAPACLYFCCSGQIQAIFVPSFQKNYRSSLGKLSKLKSWETLDWVQSGNGPPPPTYF